MAGVIFSLPPLCCGSLAGGLLGGLLVGLDVVSWWAGYGFAMSVLTLALGLYQKWTDTSGDLPKSSSSSHEPDWCKWMYICFLTTLG